MDWFWQRKPDCTFDAGTVYRCTDSKLVIETATVLEQFNDYNGIPHVRYALRLDSPYGEPGTEDLRVLSQSAFARRYSEYCGRHKAA